MRSLAKEGGLPSTLWAGPESFGRAVTRGDHAVQGVVRQKPIRVRLGLGGDELSYSVEFGLPARDQTSLFGQDPEIKRECIWHGHAWRAGAALVDRTAGLVRTRGEQSGWTHLIETLSPHETMLTEVADPHRAPEVLAMRDAIQSWRFYDHFRTDAEAPARQAHIGTRTPVLSQDGHDLVSALQTIREVGDADALDAAVADAFDGARVEPLPLDGGRFGLAFYQQGLLRPLSQAELSDLLWIAALLTPRPPSLMVLNEPETSLIGVGGLAFRGAHRCVGGVLRMCPGLAAQSAERDPDAGPRAAPPPYLGLAIAVTHAD